MAEPRNGASWTVADLCTAAADGDLTTLDRILAARPELVNVDLAENDEHRALHFAVLHRWPAAVERLLRAGADPHQGVYPHREPTTARTLALERGYDDLVALIDADEQRRREELSCPNATVSDVQQELHQAIADGDDETALRILEADPTLKKACDRHGSSPLHQAAAHGRLRVAQWLLDHRANVYIPDASGRAPLDRAVANHNRRDPERFERCLEVARLLLRHSAPMTPQAAAALGELDALRRLHEEEPDKFANGIDFNGGLLSAAVLYRRPEVLRFLLELGLEPNERHRLGGLDEEVYSQGRPLWQAALEGEHEMAELLLDHGADVNAMVYASGDALSCAYNAGDDQMRTLLLERGAKPRPAIVGLYRDTPVALAMLADGLDAEGVRELLWGAACGGAPDIVEHCLRRIDWPLDDSRWFGILDQPFRIWAHGPHQKRHDHDRSSYAACLKLLVDHGVDVNVEGRFGLRLLHDLAGCGEVWGQKVMRAEERLAMATILLDAGARWDYRDELLRSTPLGWAARFGRAEMVELLLERGAPADEPEAEPWATPLAWAEKRGHEGIARMLRVAGA